MQSYNTHMKGKMLSPSWSSLTPLNPNLTPGYDLTSNRVGQLSHTLYTLTLIGVIGLISTTRNFNYSQT